MTVERDLAMEALLAHPLESAQVLERLPSEVSARFLSRARADAGAAALGLMQTSAAVGVLVKLEIERGGELLSSLPFDTAAGLLRRLPDEYRESLLQVLGERTARSLRTSLRFELATAGALMDPDVLSIPVDIDVESAIARVREAAREARYNVYVVDRDRRLQGVLNLRELFLAEGSASIGSVMRADPHRIRADADRRAVVSHPGWRQAHALPVVDRDGVYLGAIRYRTLRRLEEELRGVVGETGATARALGDLFRTGASSLLEAVAVAPARRSGTEGGRDGA